MFQSIVEQRAVRQASQRIIEGDMASRVVLFRWRG